MTDTTDQTVTLYWRDEHGTLQLPGCTAAEARFASRHEAEEAADILETTDPATWGGTAWVYETDE